MQVGQFPASAANSLIQGYCDDFVSFAAILAQTLEQVSMRGLNFDGSRAALGRIEQGMRSLAEAIQDLLERGQVTGDLTKSLADKPAVSPPSPAAPKANTAPARPTNERPTAPPPMRSGAAVQPSAPHASPAPAGRTTAPRVGGSTANMATGARAPQRSSSEGLRGTNQSMPLLSVFQFLGRMRKAGTMRVTIGNESLTFELQNGCILATTSTQCPREELLGEMLIAGGACTADDLDPIVVRVGTGNNDRFGQAAVEAGIVSEAQVVDALGRQAGARYTRACKSSEAKYEFVEGLRNQAPSRFPAAPIAVA